MLVLSSEDILNLADHAEIIAAVERAFIMAEGENYHQPDRIHIEHEGKVLLLMPCFTEDYFITKLVSVVPENVQKGQPSLYGTLILNDGKTGQPLALMDAGTVTAIRTGAIGAVGARYTVPEEIKTIGIVGAGVQGYQQAVFIGREKKAENILVNDIDRAKSESLVGRLKNEMPGIHIDAVNNVWDLVKQSELIITATTSNTPVIPDEIGLILGKHFIGIGSYSSEMREMPKTLFRELPQLFIDTEYAIEESGEIQHPMSQGCIKREMIFTLGKLINGQIQLSDKKPSLFKSVGMALFDLVTSELIYEST